MGFFFLKSIVGHCFVLMLIYCSDKSIIGYCFYSHLLFRKPIISPIRLDVYLLLMET